MTRNRNLEDYKRSEKDVYSETDRQRQTDGQTDRITTGIIGEERKKKYGKAPLLIGKRERDEASQVLTASHRYRYPSSF